MKWTYSIKNKLLASIVLLMLCLLVLLSNYLDRKHTQLVKNSISTLYEDRLIAESYLFDLTSIIYQIREIVNSDSITELKYNAVDQLIKDFNKTYIIYSKTKLTKKEATTALELITSIKKFESDSKNYKYNSNQTQEIIFLLTKLSSIQLEESKLIMKSVESQHATIKASSQFAFAIIILILVVLQVLVFSGESIIPIIKKNDPRLN